MPARRASSTFVIAPVRLQLRQDAPIDRVEKRRQAEGGFMSWVRPAEVSIVRQPAASAK